MVGLMFSIKQHQPKGYKATMLQMQSIEEISKKNHYQCSKNVGFRLKPELNKTIMSRIIAKHHDSAYLLIFLETIFSGVPLKKP